MRPPAVAITGGIGAGKSELLKAFARHGAATISSDEIVHRLLREDEEVKQAIVEKLGRIVLRKGEIDRSRVANLVFRDRELLAWLEGLLHPRVSAEYLRWRDEQDAALTVTEVPLLFEAGQRRELRRGRRGDRARGRSDAPAPRSPRPTARRGSSPTRRRSPAPTSRIVNDGSLDELDAFAAGVVERLAAR